MARVHTHYDNLKVARDAPPEVIRAAYKTLSQKHHPDRNGNSKEAVRIIKLINSAYDVLSHPDRRQEHDQWIARVEQESNSDFAHYGSALKDDQAVQRSSRHANGHSSRHSRHTRKKSSPLSRLGQNASVFWDRLCRKLARKVFRKI